MQSRPISFLELIPAHPQYIGYVDACKKGVGGVWYSTTPNTKPFYYFWREQWPEDIAQNLVSTTNKKGTISINDLELAGILLHWLVLEYTNPTNLEFKHIGIFCDNLATVQ